ncbi:MAG: hypothetical protein AB1649_03405 [Chloroflexota bacterium]
MPTNKTLRRRLSQLENAAMPKANGILWLCRKEKLVQVDGIKMTTKKFEATYPGGTLIKVVRVEYPKQKLDEELT